MKFSIKTNVFVAAHYDPRRIIQGMQESGTVEAGLAFWSWDEMSGYAKVGTAEMTLDIDPDCGVEQVVAALREKLESDRAAFALRQKQINDQINSLLAIGNAPSEVEEVIPRAPRVAPFSPDGDIPF